MQHVILVHTSTEVADPICYWGSYKLPFGSGSSGNTLAEDLTMGSNSPHLNVISSPFGVPCF